MDVVKETMACCWAENPESRLGMMMMMMMVTMMLMVMMMRIKSDYDKEGYQQDFMKTGANHPTSLTGFGLVRDLSDI